MIRAFINANRRIAAIIAPYLPQTRENLAARYSESIADILNHLERQIVIDVGAGKRTVFAEYLQHPHNHQIIGIDISAKEIAANSDLQAKCVADIIHTLPFKDNSIDLLVSHDVLEHLESTERFFREAKRVLKPGGHFIHLFPSKFALFAVINQCLPAALSKRLLALFYPESHGIGGFPAHYNLCYYSAIKGLLSRNHLKETQIIPVFDQSAYFGFFLLFYLFSIFYELTVRKIGLKNLAGHLVVLAQKEDSPR